MRLRSSVRVGVVKKVDEKMIEKAKKRKRRNGKGKEILKDVTKETKTKKSKKEAKLNFFTCHSNSMNSTLLKNDGKTATTRGASTKSLLPREISRRINECTISIEKLKGDSILNSIIPVNKHIDVHRFNGDVQCIRKNQEVVESTPLLHKSHLSKPSFRMALENELTGTYWSSNTQSSNKSGKYNKRRSSQRSSFPIKKVQITQRSSKRKSCPIKKLQYPQSSSKRNSCPTKKLRNIQMSQNVSKKDRVSERKVKNGKQKTNVKSSVNFTLLNSKKNANVTLQQRSFNVKSRVYSQVRCDNPNKTEISILNKRKKLYPCKVAMFALSPVNGGSKSMVPNSTYEPSEIKNSDVASTAHTGDIMEIDLDKENKDFSIIQCDQEVSFRIKTASVEKFCDSNVDNELVVSEDLLESIRDKENDDAGDFIKSNDKFTSKKSVNTINGTFDGSYIIPLKERKVEIENFDEKLKCNVSSYSKQFSGTETHNEKKISTLKKFGQKKKKKKLHSKHNAVFELESNYSGENMPYQMNMACNKTIMSSVIHSMH